MGTHTWFAVPYKTDKKEIIQMAQDFLNSTKYYTESEKQMYQYAIDKELTDPICSLVSGVVDCNHIDTDKWILYLDITDWSLLQYNKEHGTNFDKYTGSLLSNEEVSQLNIELGLIRENRTFEEYSENLRYAEICKELYDNHIINKLESYSDEPRISGDPDRIIRSYEDMLDFMKTGYDREDGKHFDFYYDEERYPLFMVGIEIFFEKHPDGIIHFG